MGPKRPGLRGETPGDEGPLEPGDQLDEARAGNRGARPKDPGASKVAQPVDAQRRGGQTGDRFRGLFDSLDRINGERTQKAQGEMQVEGMSPAGTLGRQSTEAPSQGLTDLRVRPQGEDPALGARVQARRSSRTSKATRTD